MKKGKIVLISISSFLVLLFTAVIIYYFGASFKEFDALATKSFKIPGLETKFVPQGMDFDSATNNFIITGYMSNGENSRIYFVDKETGETIKYITLRVNGENYTGHAAGIAVSGNYAFISGDGYLYRINLLEAYNLENSKSLDVLDSLKTGNGADFVTIYEDNLIVGEFYKEKKYETPLSHYYTTISGETNFALSYVYKINHTKLYGIDTVIPTAVISMPNQVQGMAFSKNGDIVLSTSYSLPASQILIYENVLEQEPSKFTLNDNELDLYILCNQNKQGTIKAPAMSEELVLVDNKVFVLFESNCAKYRYFNRTRLSNVYALDL